MIPFLLDYIPPPASDPNWAIDWLDNWIPFIASVAGTYMFLTIVVYLASWLRDVDELI